MENYNIKLNNNIDKEEDFEMTGDNIAEVTVLDLNGNDVAYQSMGIMLHSGSCELIISCGDYKPYTQYLEEV